MIIICTMVFGIYGIYGVFVDGIRRRLWDFVYFMRNLAERTEKGKGQGGQTPGNGDGECRKE